MQKTADIIIIGAGITGCAIFYELVKRRTGKVLLIEKNQIASGTTGQSGGLIRKLFHSPETRLLAMNSFAYYQRFTEEVGHSCGFVKTGCQYWSLEQEDFINEADAGCINPTLACQGWINAVTHHQQVIQDTTIYQLVIENQRIIGVNTSRGLITCEYVIIAAGAWSVLLLKQHHIEVSLVAKSFQYQCYYQEQQQINSAVIDFVNQYFIVPRSNNTFIAGFLNQDKLFTSDSLLIQIDHQQTQRLHQLLVLRYPWLTSEKLINTYNALDAFSDQPPGIIGKIPTIAGLYLATGWSGGGIKIAPAVAQKIAEILFSI